MRESTIYAATVPWKACRQHAWRAHPARSNPSKQSVIQLGAKTTYPPTDLPRLPLCLPACLPACHAAFLPSHSACLPACFAGVLLCVLQVSQRVLVTDPPVIVKTKQLMARAPPSKQVMEVNSSIHVLAQGRSVHCKRAAPPTTPTPSRRGPFC